MDSNEEDEKKLGLLKNAFNLIEIDGMGKTKAQRML
jgi:hypothetical protein